MTAFLLLTRRHWPDILVVVLCAAVGLYVHNLRSTVASQGGQIASLTTNLAAEKQARERDVGGLTTLAAGLAAAHAGDKQDQAILERTIDAAHPQSLSAPLASLMRCLRDADLGATCAPASIGGTPVADAAPAR